jgi:hypothetical protein
MLEEKSLWLCDPDGVVRRGHWHHGDDYECTGSAHYGAVLIKCENPIHEVKETPVVDWSVIAPPPCENHKEVQHRDQKPPWCNACGWNYGREAVQARQLGSPHMKGTIPDGEATPKIY